MVPKFAHILIPTTYVYVTLLGKVDFSGVIRLWSLRWGDFLNYVWIPNVCGVQIMRNTGLDEAQAGIKIAGRNISNLRYADDTTLMVESEEELKSL